MELAESVFIYPSSEADERYFRQRIFEYLRGNDKPSLTKAIWEAVWERNNKGQTIKYLYFNEQIQKLYLDDTFWEWCKFMCQKMSKEMEVYNLLKKDNHG